MHTQLGWTLQGHAGQLQSSPNIQQCLFTAVSNTAESIYSHVERLLQLDVLPYEWQVLPFGTTCSPCCAIFALQKHVRDNRTVFEDVKPGL